MTVQKDPVRDWTYTDARRRLLTAGRAQLSGHAALPRLDEQGNRIVDCGCGWSGNGLGWTGHIDQVVSAALRD
jgi:hypothetical protein